MAKSKKAKSNGVAEAKPKLDKKVYEKELENLQVELVQAPGVDQSAGAQSCGGL